MKKLGNLADKTTKIDGFVALTLDFFQLMCIMDHVDVIKQDRPVALSFGYSLNMF